MPDHSSSPNKNNSTKPGSKQCPTERLGLPAKPARILVAEDEHLVAADLTLKLSDLGFTVVGPVADGQAAMDLCQNADPDLAILDIRMPGTDGLSAAERIFGSLGIPVMIVSAYSDPNDVQRAAQVGVFGYLVKPVTVDQLRVTIDVSWQKFIEHALQNNENQTLRKRLEDRKLIEQAKWILVQERNLSEPDALQLLRKHARDSRKPVADIARSLIESKQLLSDQSN